jgi:hypothetical protein
MLEHRSWLYIFNDQSPHESKVGFGACTNTFIKPFETKFVTVPDDYVQVTVEARQDEIAERLLSFAKHLQIALRSDTVKNKQLKICG